ncbi:uncharacterized protein PFL1_01334 [Pseudozyma flocculosa PF-1]|uniref:Uncharacterized protein n=1 Tax=Pseudozyma flocculosa TaxID=84751 RepID=A0A5C3EXM8_9BASI|nr:uncharacterized protein PFL1_01334 [Pseudozyma flocculosa PF-1]EPQ31145.1 hypothetical protein PFL1_01334 [Pseudozyma flocculosa PF-1]SPO36366.1 uncharacterized protein PSFLO_01837 [Pseudozyma flocculosa]
MSSSPYSSLSLGPGSQQLSYFAIHAKRSSSLRTSPPIPELLIDPLHSTAALHANGPCSLPPSPVSPTSSARPTLPHTSSSKYNDILYANTHFSRGSEILVSSSGRDGTGDRDIHELLATVALPDVPDSATAGMSHPQSAPTSLHGLACQSPVVVSEAEAYSRQVRQALLQVSDSTSGQATSQMQLPSLPRAQDAPSSKRSGLVRSLGGSLRSTGGKMTRAATESLAHLTPSSLSLPRSIQMSGTTSSAAVRRTSNSSQQSSLSRDVDRTSDCGSIHSSVSLFIKKPKTRNKLPFNRSRARPSTAPSESTSGDSTRAGTFHRSIAVSRDSSDCGSSRSEACDEPIDLETPPASASMSSFGSDLRQQQSSKASSLRGAPGSKGRPCGSHGKTSSISQLLERPAARVTTLQEEEQDWEKTLERAAATASWNTSINHRPRSRLLEGKADLQMSWPRRHERAPFDCQSLHGINLQGQRGATTTKRPALARAVSDFAGQSERKNSHYSASFVASCATFPRDACDDLEAESSGCEDQDGARQITALDEDCIPLQLDTGFDELELAGHFHARRPSTTCNRGLHSPALAPPAGLGITHGDATPRRLTVPDVPEAVTSDSSADETEDEQTCAAGPVLVTGRRRSSTIRPSAHQIGGSAAHHPGMTAKRPLPGIGQLSGQGMWACC